ncbi:septal ring lytic transglycosylase RlpA family protein [Arcticibacter eurypsychrophilus]|uniref:septal ring lytic transglycosylase RlpA family protein n=1 Tax=Arcticibacter eurypsychrophilus TaxID=1434752 RepID=UPI00084D4E57|nr:LysM peptidoglycan-binding domain-containing protein [Arcticibacter eurypsychrophilus]
MRFILAISCSLFSTGLFANNRLDSVGSENNNGKLVIIHSVSSKESYYSIGRLYHVSAKDISALNKVKILQPGALIKVPTDRPFMNSIPVVPKKEASSRVISKKGKKNVEASKNEDNSPVIFRKDALDAVQEGLVNYKVGPKETLFAIAKRFNTHVESIIEINNLKGNNLKVGQIIKVKPGAGAPLPPASPIILAPAPDTDTNAVKYNMPANRYGLKEKTEKGIAVWISDENLDGTKMLALHKTAPIGTVVRITNPMTGKTTFAKVVGKYTENESTKDVIIVISQATANMLGMLDKRSLLTIDYGVPYEQ